MNNLSTTNQNKGFFPSDRSQKQSGLVKFTTIETQKGWLVRQYFEKTNLCVMMKQQLCKFKSSVKDVERKFKEEFWS